MYIQKYLLSISLMLMLNHLFAQSKLIIKDQTTQDPIEGLYFQYGNQEGTSDKNGIIQFILETDQSMLCSHINYGTWTISSEILRSSVETGNFFRERIDVYLYPVTVISVRQGKSPSENRSLDHLDKVAHDASAILKQTAGFTNIRKSGSYGLDPVFRGFKYDRLNIVINGAQSATAACPNRMDPPTSQMAPNMMERVEILKGPFSLRYGAGMGATINFIPVELWFNDRFKTYGRTTFAYETNGNIQRNETQLGFNGNFYDISLYGSWSQGDDYMAGNKDLVQSDFKRGSFGTTMGFKIAANQELRLSTTYNRARDADFPALMMDLRNDDTWLFNARHDIQLNKNLLKSWNTTAFASIVDHTMDNLMKPLDPRMLNAATIAATKNYGGRTEGQWLLTKGSLYLGADYRSEYAEGTRTREFLMGPMAGNTAVDNVWQDGQINKAAVFGEYIFKYGKLSTVLSGRTEINTTSIDQLDEGFDQLYDQEGETHINPSVSTGISYDLTQSSKIGLWIGRVQRSGSLAERFINFFPIGQDPYELVGNPNLDPEANNQVDVTYQYTKQNITLDADLFVSYLQNYITSVIDPTLSPRIPMSPGVRQFINIDQAFKTGFEVSAKHKITDYLNHQVAIAYTYAQDLVLDQPLPETPPLDLRYQVSAGFLDQKLKPSVEFRHVLEQARIAAEFGETVTPEFTVVDQALTYRIIQKLQVNASVQNLFNENYYEHLNRSVSGTLNPIFERGRSFNLAVNYTF